MHWADFEIVDSIKYTKGKIILFLCFQALEHPFWVCLSMTRPQLYSIIVIMSTLIWNAMTFHCVYVFECDCHRQNPIFSNNCFRFFIFWSNTTFNRSCLVHNKLWDGRICKKWFVCVLEWMVRQWTSWVNDNRSFSWSQAVLGSQMT